LSAFVGLVLICSKDYSIFSYGSTKKFNIVRLIRMVRILSDLP